MTDRKGIVTSMEKIKSCLPAQNDILPALAVISFMVYGWTLVVFLWKVPSWVMWGQKT